MGNSQGNKASPRADIDVIAAEARKICSIYQEVSPPNSAVFEEAFKECLKRRQAPECALSRMNRRSQADSLTDDFIFKELERQAEAYMCAEVAADFKNCIKSTDGSSDNRKCVTLEKAFKDCIHSKTTPAAIVEYREGAREAFDLMHIKREKSYEQALATRLHFKFGP
jgi:hypothetical protein